MKTIITAIILLATACNTASDPVQEASYLYCSRGTMVIVTRDVGASNDRILKVPVGYVHSVERSGNVMFVHLTNGETVDLSTDSVVADGNWNKATKCLGL